MENKTFYREALKNTVATGYVYFGCVDIVDEDIFGIKYDKSQNTMEYRLGNWTWTGWCKSTDSLMVFLQIMSGCRAKEDIDLAANELNKIFVINEDLREQMKVELTDDFWYWFSGGNKLNFELSDTQYSMVEAGIDDYLLQYEDEEVCEYISENRYDVIDKVFEKTIELNDVIDTIRWHYGDYVEEIIETFDSFEDIMEQLDGYGHSVECTVFDVLIDNVCDCYGAFDIKEVMDKTNE